MTSLMATEIQKQQEDEILLACQALSDANAFAELYQRNVTRVYRYHMAHTGNVKDAEDLTSKLLLQHWKAFVRFAVAVHSVPGFWGSRRRRG